MINFTVGPVQSADYIREIGSEQVPYFRTPEFSQIMLESEQLMKKLTNAPEDARTVFLTGSGTAAMEAAISNTLTEADKVLLINGGSFGERFSELMKIYNIPCDEIRPEYGRSVTAKQLAPFDGKGYSAFVVNIHETSTGVLYDIDIIREFCKRNNLFLIVDAISSFLADPIDFKESGIDVLITGSQKALACPPGVSVLVLSAKAQNRIANSRTRCMYLDLKSALKNGERGQIHARLKAIDQNGGAAAETEKIAALARDFREKITALPFDIASQAMSNAVTPISPKNCSAYKIFTILKDEYGIWVCPNGGELADKIFRVGHIGALTIKDNDILIDALFDMQRRGLI